MDMTAFFKLSYGLYVVGVKEGAKLNACVVNTVLQVTVKPAQVVTVVSKANYTHDLIAAKKSYAVSALAQDAPMETIAAFGFRSGRECEKFAGIAYRQDENGNPFLTEHVAAVFTCKVVNTVDVGTHTMFVSEVTDAKLLEDCEALTYTHYQQVKKGATPKNAPVYNAAKAADGQYQCSVCHYIYDGAAPFEELDDDYKCPICGQPKAVFVKL